MLLPAGAENNQSSDDNEVEEVTTRTLNFTVNDSNGSVEGAAVVIGDVTGTTGSAGGCSLQNISDGEHTVTVTKEGYEDYTGTITVSENNTSFTVTLTAL